MHNNLSELELSRIKNISQHNLLSLSIDNNEYITTNSIEVNNDENIETNKSCFKDRNKNNLIMVPLHLILHIILLSIFEIVLYFHYITKIENKVFYDKIEDYINNVNFDNRLNDPLIANTINFELNSENSKNYLYNLKELNDNSITDRNDYNSNLEQKSYFITYILSGIFIFYILINVFKFELKLKKLIAEHVVLLLCIGLYEIWFFYNVILKYKLIDSDEINYIVTSCLLKKLNQLPSINLNSTVIHSCKLL